MLYVCVLILVLPITNFFLDGVFRVSFYQQVAAAYKKGKFHTVENKDMSTTATGDIAVNQGIAFYFCV